ncbi:NUDIX hydrolase [Microbacterium sp. CR_7]|uniref:NUDIX hydrolase n=1 Tax=Microbacterium sp. CR_7 TaxID=3055792 RepID=UPI0035BFD007
MRPEPWEVLSRRVLVEDEWIHLRADDCRASGGRSIAPYYVLEYPDWVSVLALDRDGRAIVVDEYRHGGGVIALGTIGGGVAVGETPAAAAARELREETGYASSEIVDLGATWANFGNQTNRVHHFLALGCRVVGEPEPDENETITVQILPMETLGEQLRQSYHQLTWFKARDWIARETPAAGR